jgi:hypothetical protein
LAILAVVLVLGRTRSAPSNRPRRTPKAHVEEDRED